MDRLSDARGPRFEFLTVRIRGKSTPSLRRDKHPAIKGFRPPEHFAGHSIRTKKTPRRNKSCAVHLERHKCKRTYKCAHSRAHVHSHARARAHAHTHTHTHAHTHARTRHSHAGARDTSRYDALAYTCTFTAMLVHIARVLSSSRARLCKARGRSLLMHCLSWEL